jgi:RNA 2',3'-cyclic 3'-phosphodiesterase
MRLFMALDLTDAARQAIAAEQRRLGTAMGGSDRSSFKWVRPEHMHLTLVFLGEVDEGRSAGLVETLGPAVELPPFKVVFGGIGMFPPSGAPRVLWLGVREGARDTVELQRRLVDRVQAAGIAVEGREFHPHLTLARWRTSGMRDRQRVLALGHGSDIGPVEASEAVLYHSRLSSQGPTYSALARVKLRAHESPV